MSEQIRKAAGYVKLAKLWERSAQQAVDYHGNYYLEKYAEVTDMDLVGVFIDITGNKETYRRPEMVRLIRECMDGRVNVIDLQTRAYLAANGEELCFLLHFLFNIPERIDIVTEDDDKRIDTILDVENQRKNLKKMADKYVSLEGEEYASWLEKLAQAMKELD